MRAAASAEIRVGANPIIWSNDDFRDLGGDIPLEQCLAEMQTAGYAGSELGHKYPRNPDILEPLLDTYDLQLVSGWHSLYLLDRPFEEERRRYLEHLELLQHMRSSVIIAAECSRRIYHDPGAPLRFDAHDAPLSDSDWDRLTSGLESLANLASGRGLRLVYHHHMGTVIQNRSEIDELMRRTEALHLLADTGHLAFADVDPLEVFRAHLARISHVHLKDVRPEIVRRARSERHGFATAVRAGVFTVPGDGGIDFAPIVELLRGSGYRGWLVVEADQDPRRSPPLRYARMGRAYIRQVTGI